SGNCINRKPASPLTYEWCTPRGKVKIKKTLNPFRKNLRTPISSKWVTLPMKFSTWLNDWTMI
ncbi:hypothetical protein, partial [Pandoraea capi]|uniref:hypothetical protein n=1 Tax=Pandoraea capi TaxID=2508286 RepID=UPI001C2D7E2A